MNLSDVNKIKVKRKKRHRVGRGQGSGWGTTSGRGHKGAGQRSGTRFRLQFEGGQMPLYRRLPKKGFTNAKFKVTYHAVNVGDLEKVFEAGDEVNLDIVKSRGLAPKKAKFFKVLGYGDLTKKLVITAHGVSAGAKTKIEEAGGSVELLPTRTEYRERGVRKDGTTAADHAVAKTAEAAPEPAPVVEEAPAAAPIVEEVAEAPEAPEAPEASAPEGGDEASEDSE